MNDEKFRVSISLDVDLSQQDIDDIMVAALEGGINYWCREAEVVGEMLGDYAHEQISRGGTLILHDAESSDKWDLTLEKFLRGVELYFAQALSAELDGEDIDPTDFDADAVDCIVQYALFGKLVFG
jgi:hypothetical protein